MSKMEMVFWISDDNDDEANQSNDNDDEFDQSYDDDVNDHLYNSASLPLQGEIGDKRRIRRQKVGRGGRGVC